MKKAEIIKKVIDNYNLAVQYAPNGENTAEVVQLRGKIDELESMDGSKREE